MEGTFDEYSFLGGFCSNTNLKISNHKSSASKSSTWLDRRWSPGLLSEVGVATKVNRSGPAFVMGLTGFVLNGHHFSLYKALSLSIS